MEKANILDKKPLLIELDANKKYAWCACGHTSNQAFCDGTHKGRGFSPVIFEVEETKKYALCQCKQTKNPPFCDGAHASL